VNPTGAGRTSIFEELAARGVDVEQLTLFNLDEVYSFLPEDKLTEIANDISIGGFAVTVQKDQPTFKPATAPAATPAPQPTTNQPPAATPVPAPTTVVHPATTTVPASTPVPVPQTVGSGQAPAQPAPAPTAEPVIPDPPVNS
jgi:hypothetical protein